MFAKTLAHTAASVVLHGSIVGAVLVFSAASPAPEEQVYRVTLAEFSAPAPVQAAPVQPAPPEPEPARPEPVPEPPKPKPEPVAEVPKAKPISTKKAAEKPKAAKKAEPAPQPVRTADAGPAREPGPTMNIGGIAAYDVDAVDQRPAIARRVLPDYPQKARRMNVQGRVVVRLVVDVDGNPKECRIHHADPTGYFEDAAIEAAKKTRFIPGKVKGRAVNTAVLVPFVFALR